MYSRCVYVTPTDRQIFRSIVPGLSDWQREFIFPSNSSLLLAPSPSLPPCVSLLLYLSISAALPRTRTTHPLAPCSPTLSLCLFRFASLPPPPQPPPPPPPLWLSIPLCLLRVSLSFLHACIYLMDPRSRTLPLKSSVTHVDEKRVLEFLPAAKD